jgi:hypothetical protein
VASVVQAEVAATNLVFDINDVQCPVWNSFV